MPSPWSSSRDASPQASRLLIERAHEELVAGNLDDTRLQQVRPLVRASWQRAWHGRVGAEGRPPLAFTPEALEEYRTGHPLAGAMDLIRGLVIDVPIHMGDVVLEDLLNTGIDLIASMDIDPALAAHLGRSSFSYPVIRPVPPQLR